MGTMHAFFVREQPFHFKGGLWGVFFAKKYSDPKFDGQKYLAKQMKNNDVLNPDFPHI